MVTADPRREIYGGTAATTLSTLEQAGVVVARAHLDRMRDSNPLYSSLWRLGMGWWSDPFDEAPGRITATRSADAAKPIKADDRQELKVFEDDGAGR